ncbi:MAG TPA: hypothetical protein VFG56_01230 [Candidatus Saccharimonadales bacterium]|nr:hypothetical protein [Candidatus Saccharimonadales bacterium]
MSLLGRLSPLGDLKTKQLIKSAVETYSLVYFGTVSQTDDEHATVKGVTFSPRHIDHHYSVGTVEGFDVTLLQRTDSLSAPGKPIENYRWLLLRVSLKPSIKLSHVLVDTAQYNQTYYANLFAKFSRLNSAKHCFEGPAYGEFSQAFHCYTTPDNLDHLAGLIGPDTAQTILQHFPKFDVEWFDNQIIISSPEPLVSSRTIEMMLREALWLARYFESV